MELGKERHHDVVQFSRQTEFAFGLETEFMLVDRLTFQPLWYPDLDFEKLNGALNEIELDELGPLAGLYPNPPHRPQTPYIIEGYHVFDSAGQARGILPKGVEIRTPKCRTVEECLSALQILHRKMQQRLKSLGYVAVTLSHHPTQDRFEGPQQGRTPELWRWAMQAMVTYGPDINVSLPGPLLRELDLADLDARVNYYAPALTALSLASPFYQAKPWRIDGHQVKAARTYQRSLVGPAIEIHPEQEWRLEFKPFEMSWRVADYHCYFLLWLELILDSNLEGRAGASERIRGLRQVAIDGLKGEETRARAHEVLEAADFTLPRFGFDTSALEIMTERVSTQRTPADELLDHFHRTRSLAQVLGSLTTLIPQASPLAPSSADICENLPAGVGP